MFEPSQTVNTAGPSAGTDNLSEAARQDRPRRQKVPIRHRGESVARGLAVEADRPYPDDRRSRGLNLRDRGTSRERDTAKPNPGPRTQAKIEHQQARAQVHGSRFTSAGSPKRKPREGGRRLGTATTQWYRSIVESWHVESRSLPEK
jgi:hypothetical protein